MPRPEKIHPDNDGLGNPIDPEGLYYVQDTRQAVGNCALWWRPDGAGYACDIDDSGIYKGERVLGMRASDLPWPVEFVQKHVVRHVRSDVLYLAARDLKGKSA